MAPSIIEGRWLSVPQVWHAPLPAPQQGHAPLISALSRQRGFPKNTPCSKISLLKKETRTGS